MEDTLNYVSVYEVIYNEMQKPRELLETLLQEMTQSLKEKFDEITQINLTLYKLTAPIPNLKGRVGIQYSKLFKDSQ